MKNNKKVMYISLPMTGRDMQEIKDRLAYLKDKLSKYYNIITPLDLVEDNDYTKPYGYYIGKDIECIIEKVDIVCFDGNWYQSKGCKMEHYCARTYDKDIKYTNDYAKISK